MSGVGGPASHGGARPLCCVRGPLAQVPLALVSRPSSLAPGRGGLGGGRAEDPVPCPWTGSRRHSCEGPTGLLAPASLQLVDDRDALGPPYGVPAVPQGLSGVIRHSFHPRGGQGEGPGPTIQMHRVEGSANSVGPCPPPPTGRFLPEGSTGLWPPGVALACSARAAPPRTAPRRGQLGSGLCPCQQEGPAWGPAVGLFLPGARHWPLDTENSGGNVCFRSRLQASGCMGPQEAPSLQSQEDLEPFVGQRHQGGQPSRVVWTDNPPPTSPQGPASAPPAPVPV